jgi:hypothetical protein
LKTDIYLNREGISNLTEKEYPTQPKGKVLTPIEEKKFHHIGEKYSIEEEYLP